MVTEPDVAAIKDRIILIMKKDTDLSGQDKKKLRKIEFGLPDDNNITGLTYPIAFVYDNDDFEDDKPFGPVSANSMGVSEHIFRFNILILDHQKDAKKLERTVNNLYKLTKEVLKENVGLRDPDNPTDASTALVTESFPRKGKSFSAQFRGKPLDGKTIILTCKVHSS